MKKMLLSLLVVLCALLFCNCGYDNVEPGEEGVIVKQPYFFGFEGVVPTPVLVGNHLCALSTHIIRYNIKPIEFTESFDDLICADNNPVDFKAYLELCVQKGKAPILHETFGVEFYANKIKEKFRTYIRNFGRGKTMFELTTDAEVTIAMALAVKDSVAAYVKREGIDVTINRVTIGKVSPPVEVLEETIRTAAQKQRKRTEDARADAEINRKKAEENKADADKAYKERFGMTNDQYIRIRGLELDQEKIDMIKNKNNVSINVIMGNAVPMFGVGK